MVLNTINSAEKTMHVSVDPDADNFRIVIETRSSEVVSSSDMTREV